MFGRGQKNDAARLTDGERRLHVLIEEEPLNAELSGPVGHDQLRYGTVDLEQPTRQLLSRQGLEAAVVDQAQGAALALDQPVAGSRCAGIYTQDDHAIRPWSAAAQINMAQVLRPRGSGGGQFGKHLIGQVEVGGHALNVVQVFESLHQTQVLTGDVRIDLDGRLGAHGQLR